MLRLLTISALALGALVIDVSAAAGIAAEGSAAAQRAGLVTRDPAPAQQVVARGLVSGFTGTVTDDVSMAAITFAEVAVFDAGGGFVGSFAVNGSGVYTAEVAPGTYYARTSTAFGPYVDELWDDVQCGFLCVPTDGAAIVVPPATVVPDIDFELAHQGFQGTVTEDPSGYEVPFATVDVFDSAGALAGSFIAQIDGTYTAGLPAGTWYARTSTAGFPYVDELWDDLPCPGASCDPTSGTPIVVGAHDVLTVDFALETAGFSGFVTDQNGGSFLSLPSIAVFDSSGDLVGTFLGGVFGDYLAAVPPGTYYATATSFAGPYLSELYGGAPCPGGFGCDPTTGTAIVVTSGSIASGIDFVLAQNGFTGTVTEAGSGTPIPLAQVSVFDSAGDFVADFFTAASGSYAAGLPSGTWYARAAAGAEPWVAELFDDVVCPGQFMDPLGEPCDPTTGTAIVVASVISGVDFALTRSGFTGAVTEAGSGDPLPLTDVVVYDDSGDFVATFTSGLDGTYAAGVPAGDYHARTDSVLGHADELWDDHPCDDGTCDPTTGDTIAVAAATVVPSIDFELVAPSPDFDGDGAIDALTDGLLLLRFLLGFTGGALTTGVVGSECSFCVPGVLAEVLALLEPLFDVDGNGSTEALTDGVLVLRYLFGFRGDALVAGAVAGDCTRCSAGDIEGYLAGLLG